MTLYARDVRNGAIAAIIVTCLSILVNAVLSDMAYLSRTVVSEMVVFRSKADKFHVQSFSLMGLAMVLTRKDAPWRKLPATEKQKAILDERNMLYRDGITRGEASHIISVLSARKRRGAPL